jgi:DNA mismatch repair protein MutS
VAIENQIFLELREKLVKYFADIQAAAKVVGALDVLAAYALLAKKNNYCQPIVNNEGILNIEKGRHPVIEQYVERYVPNDIFLDHEKNEMILLTGPNMSGKSSFLRQIAIATLMAQIGSFVPATKATIGVVDRIFTRVGASDNLAQGVSTFMNEMQEAANIINNATDKSLIILDEIGRGTSTYDGVSLASAIIEHLHNTIRAKTLFATHFHELIDVANRLERAENYCVAVTENNGQVVFLHQIIRGATSDSYGIEVAKLAGLPKHLTDRAQEILRDLEEKSQRPVEHRPEQTALPLSQKEELLTKELEAVDPDHLTPMQALEKLVDLKGKTNNKNS